MSNSADLEFVSGETWRLWLEENNSSSKDVWVVIQKKNSPKQGLLYDVAVEEAVCFGWIDGKMQGVDGDSFRLRFSPRRKRSVWSKEEQGNCP